MTDQVLGLPQWPDVPPAVDESGGSHLVLALGEHPRTIEVATGWLREAQTHAPSRLVDRIEDVEHVLQDCRTGVRLLVVGDQYDVLTTLATARAHGLGPAELRCFVVEPDAEPGDLPVFCAHCRATHRVRTRPGSQAGCPGCGRTLEVHPHHSASRGSFLASDARARELS